MPSMKGSLEAEEEKGSSAAYVVFSLPFLLLVLVVAVDFLPLDLVVFEAKWRLRRRDEETSGCFTSPHASAGPHTPLTTPAFTCLESDERKALPSIVDQDLKAEDRLKDDSNPLLESDRAKQLEAKRGQGENRNTLKRRSRLSPNGVRSSDASKDAQNQGKIGENDVFTVGPVEIEITDTNRSISGTGTVGSMPVDIKGSKNIDMQICIFLWGKDVSIENMHQGFTHVFESTFESIEGIAEYVSHPVHVEFSNNFLPALEKVIVIDYKPTPA
ncbi:uncharacterized protein A4U43_C08F32710 [Asparagus officinalis]|nr:uncharacterized protein A4U43_C08F32710 [Asparagus officinalis]